MDHIKLQLDNEVKNLKKIVNYFIVDTRYFFFKSKIIISL